MSNDIFYCFFTLGEVQRVMSLRNPLSKMSKSDNQEMSCINLTDSPDMIMKKVKRAVTDCDGAVYYDLEARPGVSNLVSIYAAISGSSHDEIRQEFEGKVTVDFKNRLGEVLVASLGPIREEIERLEKDVDYVDSVLREGSQRATEIATENLNQVKKKIGISL